MAYKFIKPIINNGICKPKLVKIALSLIKKPAIVQPITPKPCKKY